VRNHPELKDAQISRLVGTTKSTIEQIRNRTHWNAANLTPMDPVTLGLCSQIDLDLEVSKSAKDRPLPSADEMDNATLASAQDTENLGTDNDKGMSADEVFSRFASLGNSVKDDDENDDDDR